MINRPGRTSSFACLAVAAVSVFMLLNAFIDDAGAQSFTQMYRFDGGAAFDGLGSSVTSAGDVDGDGVKDIVVGAYSAPHRGVTQGGSVFVYSGANGSLIRRIDGEKPYGLFGYSVAAVDVNGDGFADIVVGAPRLTGPGSPYAGSGSIFVYSGRDGALLWKKDGESTGDTFGWHVATIKDLNGDGRPDILVGAEGGNRAFVLSGVDGSVIFQKSGTGGFGVCVTSIGDINGDGKENLIIGTEIGRVFVYSGADGSLMAQINSLDWKGSFGEAVAGGGDINGDGIPDFVVGASGASPFGRIQAGSIYVYSGKNFSLLKRLDGVVAGDHLGGCCGALSAVGDVNGDGRADIVAAAGLASPNGNQHAGSVYVYSFLGNRWTLLKRFDGAVSDDQLGTFIDLCGGVSNDGDIDGDGRVEIIIGGPQIGPAAHVNAGSVFVYSMHGH